MRDRKQLNLKRIPGKEKKEKEEKKEKRKKKLKN